MRIVLDYALDFARTFPGLTASIVSVLILLPVIFEIFEYVHRLMAHIGAR